MIGAYAICHKDADWLVPNIQRMYDRIDRFSVVVGPVGKYLGAEEDTDSAERLHAMPDPDHKITIKSGVWEDKNAMCRAALSDLETPHILQLDADEFWPDKALADVVCLLKKGQRKIRVHMYTFFKTADYIMEAPDSLTWICQALHCRRGTMEKFMRGDSLAGAELRGETGRTTEVDQEQFEKFARLLNVRHSLIEDKRKFMVTMFCKQSSMAGRMAYGDPPSWSPWLLDMHRAFRPCPHTRVTHIPPDLQWPNGESAHDYAQVTLKHPIWHFSYIGRERWIRKAQLFNVRAGRQVMPSVDDFDMWDESQVGEDAMMTGQVRRVKRYDGPVIPEEIKALVKGMEAK